MEARKGEERGREGGEGMGRRGVGEEGGDGRGRFGRKRRK